MKISITFNKRTTDTLFCGTLLLLVAFFVFGSSGQDDPYITFAAAQQLAETGHIVNINGEAVEQGSSVLHVAILALLYKLTGISLGELGVLTSLFFALACFPLAHRLALQMGIVRTTFPLTLLALSTAFVYWSMGALESTLAAFVVLHLVLAVIAWLQPGSGLRGIAMVFAAVAAFLLTRPEAFFVTLLFVALATALCLPSQPPYRKLATLLLMAMGMFALLAAWRYHTFGQAFPQPVYAKAGDIGLQKILFGLGYFVVSAQASIILYSLNLLRPLYGWVRGRGERNPAFIVTAAFCMAYLAFVIASGGDWMGGGRFFVPIMPLLVLSFAYYLQRSVHYTLYRRLLFLLLAVEIAVFAELQATGMPLQRMNGFKASVQPAPDWKGYSWVEISNYIHANDIALLDAMTPLLNVVLQQQTQVVISGVQMGMVPYFLKQHFGDRVYFVDMRGLTTRHVTDCPAFADAKRLWTGLFVDYAQYFAVRRQGSCQLPEIDLLFELQNLNKADNAARLQALADYGYRIVFHQETDIQGGILGKKVLNSPYIIAVSDRIYRLLPATLQQAEKHWHNTAPGHRSADGYPGQ